MPVYLAVAGLIIVFVGGTLGRAIFPTVDAGQFTLRMRAPAGTRIEETESSPTRRWTLSAARSARRTSRSLSALSVCKTPLIRSTPSISGQAGRKKRFCRCSSIRRPA